MIVSPGFIDVHTHYDAQAFWDPTFSPSCYHGVTTVVGGFCGFSIAPLTSEASDYLLPMLARVEGMPQETLRAGVPWDWSSFDDFLTRLEGTVGLNCGFFVGHSCVRRVVMGERAVGEVASSHDIARMRELVDVGLTPFEALRTSTTIPYEYLREAADAGTVAVGKRSDLILVGGDPLEDVGAASRIEGVLMRGRWIDKEEIDRRMARIRAQAPVPAL